MSFSLKIFYSIILLFVSLILNAGYYFTTLRTSDNYFLLSEELIKGVDSETHYIRSLTFNQQLTEHHFLEGVIDHINKIVESLAKGAVKLSKGF